MCIEVTCGAYNHTLKVGICSFYGAVDPVTAVIIASALTVDTTDVATNVIGPVVEAVSIFPSIVPAAVEVPFTSQYTPEIKEKYRGKSVSSLSEEIGKFRSPSQTIGSIIRGYKIATIKKLKEKINNSSSTGELGELQFAPTAPNTGKSVSSLSEEIGKFRSPSQTIGSIIRGYKIATIKKLKEKINNSSTGELGELQFAPTAPNTGKSVSSLSEEIGKFRSPSQTIGSIIRGYKIATIKKLKEKINNSSSTGELQFAPTAPTSTSQNTGELGELQFAPTAPTNYIINNPIKWDEDKF